MRIFLVGYMGTGKTHWGSLWASAHNTIFFDLDAEIEKREGISIAEIFEQQGEAYFRKAESEVLRSIVKEAHCIVSTGGGAPCFYQNMEWMNLNGRTVFLEAEPEYVYKNILHQKNKRPLLKGISDQELLSFITEKMGERASVYQLAAKTVQAKQLSLESFDQIVKELNQTDHA